MDNTSASVKRDPSEREWLSVVPVGLFFLVAGAMTFLGFSIKRPELGISLGLFLGVIMAPFINHFLEEKVHGAEASEIGQDLTERLKLYIDGKIKRFWLLFGVNGGVFAIVRLLIDQPGGSSGGLTKTSVATGAVLFTMVMTLDIWAWGTFMRRPLLGNYAFSSIVQVILLLIGGLISAAWVLAAKSNSC